MNTRTKLLTASAGVLLLAGVGGTLALWSDATTGDSLLASTGYLDVVLDTAYVWDVSPQCVPTVWNVGDQYDGTVPGFNPSGLEPGVQGLYYVPDTGYNDSVAPTVTAGTVVTYSTDGAHYQVTAAGVTWQDCSGTGGSPRTSADAGTGGPLAYSVDYTGSPDPTAEDYNADYGTLLPADGVALGSTEFQMVPGDIIRLVAPVDVQLNGQNIAAKLTASMNGTIQSACGTGIDGSSTAVFSKCQFSVQPIAILQESGPDIALADTLAPGFVPGPALTYYFQGSDSGKTSVYVVVEVQFLNLMDSSADGVVTANLKTTSPGLNDNDGMTIVDGVETDLMAVDSLSLINSLDVQLIQVRS